MLIIASALLTFFAGILLAVPFYGTDVLNTLTDAAQSITPENIALVKYFQIVNQVGVFFIPVLVFSLLTTDNITGYLRLNHFPQISSTAIVIILIFSILPFIHWLSQINETMHLPDFLNRIEEWMKQSEEKNMKLTEAFLSTTTLSGLFVNLIMIGVLAAIGEELLFRSVLIRLFREWTGNVHVAVFLSAVVFSAFHLQFFGFLPRFLLGLIFGYLFVWSGSVWLPVVAHFINNASAVVVYYLVNTGHLQTRAEDFGATTNIPLIVASFAGSVLLLVLIRFIELKKQPVKSI